MEMNGQRDAHPPVACELGASVAIQPGAIVGLQYKDGCGPARIGAHSLIRLGSIIYGDVETGVGFQSGHHVVIREFTKLGDHVVIGTNTVIEGHVEIGDFVKVESNCFIPTHTRVGRRVFLGPNVTLTNDKYPLKMRSEYRAAGPVIEDGVTLGAGVVVLPGVRIGRGAFVSAGAVVTRDVPPMSLVTGVPGRILDLPEKLKEINTALSWMRHLGPND
jgi:acetyltransferase-like isoleucine patch superfamily enzyme